MYQTLLWFFGLLYVHDNKRFTKSHGDLALTHQRDGREQWRAAPKPTSTKREETPHPNRHRHAHRAQAEIEHKRINRENSVDGSFVETVLHRAMPQKT